MGTLRAYAVSWVLGSKPGPPGQKDNHVHIDIGMGHDQAAHHSRWTGISLRSRRQQACVSSRVRIW